MSCLILKNISKIYGYSSENQSIWIEGTSIHEISEHHKILSKILSTSRKNIEEIDCSNLIALPGFIDSHTHLLFAGSRENELYMRANKTSYMEIMAQGGGIYNTVAAVRKAPEEALIRNGLKYLDKALSFGITTIEIKSGYGLDYKNEKKMLSVIQKLNDLHPVDIIPTYLVHAVPKNVERTKYIDQVANQMIPDFREFANWFDLFLEKNVFEIHEANFLLHRANKAGYHIGLHTNQINDIGGIPLALDFEARHVDHLEILKDPDVKRIIASEFLYPVFLPGSESYMFSERIGQIHKLMDISDRIVLSTDFNPGSSPVLSPQCIMAMAVLRYRISDPGFLINAFTVNPANMLFLNDRGKIEHNMKADIILMDLERFEQIPYFGTINLIRHVIKNGTLVK